MDPVTVSIVISAPRERIFDFLQDVANHPAFTDHFLVDWRLTRERSVGVGAGARYRVKAPLNRFAWGEIVFEEVQRPWRIVGFGRTGKSNRIRTFTVYELQPAASGTTKVQLTYETTPATLSDRIMESAGSRAWVRRKHARALRRLRGLMEEDGAIGRPDSAAAGARPTPRRVTVAGG